MASGCCKLPIRGLLKIEVRMSKLRFFVQCTFKNMALHVRVDYGGERFPSHKTGGQKQQIACLLCADMVIKCALKKHIQHGEKMTRIVMW